MKLVTAFILFLCLSKSIGTFSQKTYLIDYSGIRRSGGNDICFAFQNPVAISGYSHQSIFGTPQKGLLMNSDCWSDGYVTLPCDGSSSAVNISASGLKIPFAFKKNFTYDISINAMGMGYSNSNGAIGTPMIGTQTTIAEPPTRADCGYSNSYPNSIRDPFSVISLDYGYCGNANLKWYTPFSGVIPENRNYLSLVSFPQTPAYRGGDVIIRSLRIIETPPPFSILGDDFFCFGQKSYSLNNIAPACSATSITWSVSPQGIANFVGSVNNSTCTLSKSSSGYVTLTASYISCDQTIKTLTKTVHVGSFSSSDYTMTWNNGTQPYYCFNQNLTFILSGAPAGTAYTWITPSTSNLVGWTKLYDGNVNTAVYRTPTTSPNLPTTGNVITDFTEPCGAATTKVFQVIYASMYCVAQSPYKISPSPASSSITISCISLQNPCNISQVQITDIHGSIKSSQSWAYPFQQVQMPIPTTWQNGTYIAKIYNGSQWFSNQFIVQR